MYKTCLNCGESYQKPLTQSKREFEKRKFCGNECRALNMKTWKGEKANAFKGDKINYNSFHMWLYYNFGKANRCENRESGILDFKCSGKFNKFQWALKRGFSHSHNRDNYLMLCISCHQLYDFTEEKRKNLSESHKGQIPWQKKILQTI